MRKNRRMYTILSSFCTHISQLEKVGWSADSMDLCELNEAFSAQSLAVVKELKIDPNKAIMIMLHIIKLHELDSRNIFYPAFSTTSLL